MRVERLLLLAALVIGSITLGDSRVLAGPAYWLNEWNTQTVDPSAGFVTVGNQDEFLWSQIEMESDPAYVHTPYESSFSVDGGFATSRNFRVDDPNGISLTIASLGSGWHEFLFPQTWVDMIHVVEVYSETEFIDGIYESKSFGHTFGGRLDFSQELSLNLGPGDYQIDVQTFISSGTLNIGNFYPQVPVSFALELWTPGISRLVSVPEPSSLAASLIGLTLAGANFVWRRRKANSASWLRA